MGITGKVWLGVYGLHSVQITPQLTE